MKRKVPFLMIITGSNNLVDFLIYIHLARNGMAFLWHQIPSLHPFILSYQKLFELKNHEKWRKAFPRSCPLKIKDSVALSPWSNECLETFEIAKSKRNFPTFQKRPCFPSETVHHYVAQTRTQAKRPRTLHIYVLLCTFHRTAETRNTVKYVRGTSGTWHWHSEASPSLSSSLSYTPPSISLLSSVSQSRLLWGSA